MPWPPFLKGGQPVQPWLLGFLVATFVLVWALCPAVGVLSPSLCKKYVVLHVFCMLARDVLLDDWTAWPLLRVYRLGLGQPKGHSPEESGRALERPPYIK